MTFTKDVGLNKCVCKGTGVFYDKIVKTCKACDAGYYGNPATKNCESCALSCKTC